MRYFMLLTLFVLLLVGCGSSPAETTSIASPLAPIATTVVTATPEPAETPTPTPEPLTAAAIFELLSPSMAYIKVASSSGSGALLEDGYILTNAHVIWPYNAANITFPDGSVFEDVPLVAQDTLRDIALLGPIDTDLPPINFVDGESAVVGGGILLIGYPGERGRSPEPTLSQGLISRIREWEEGGITFFQTSSAVAGGQSGGIAVTLDGDVIGLSGHRFTEANFGLIASAADLNPLVTKLIADAGGLVNDPRELRTIDSQRFDMSTSKNSRAYRLVATPDSPVEISIEGPDNVNLGAYYPDGTEVVFADDTLVGKETIRFTMPSDGIPIFVIANYLGNFTGRFAITSNQPLVEIVDLDDGMPVNIGGSYTGTIHYPYDNDLLIILLDEGEEVTVRVDTIGFDPVLAIDSKAGIESFVGDNDTGGGLFGVNPELTYKAPRSGTVNAFVFDLSGTGAGSSYTITVSEPYEGAPTPMSPKPTPTPIAAAVGQMRLYDNPILPFTFEVPFDFETGVNNPICNGYDSSKQPGVCLTDAPYGMSGTVIMAVSENADQLGLEELTLDKYVSLIRMILERNPQVIIANERRIETVDGDPAVLLELTTPDTETKMLRFIHVQHEREANSLSIFYDASQQEMIDYIINTYHPR